MAVNDVYQIAAVFNNPNADGDIVNVYHYRQTSYDGVSSEVAMLISCMNFLEQELAANYMPLVATDFTFARLVGFIVNNPIYGSTLSSGTAGSAAGEYLPIRTAPVATKNTSLRGRSYRGRLYLLPPMEADQNGGGWITSAKAAVQGVLDNLLELVDVVQGNTFKMTVYSAELSTPPSLIIDNVVTSITLKQVFGSVRGRQRVT